MFPKNVCGICKNHLSSICLFIEKCKKNDMYLKKVYLKEINDACDSDNCDFEQNDESLIKTQSEVKEKNNLILKPLKSEIKLKGTKSNERSCSNCGVHLNQGGIKKHYRLNPNCRPDDYKCPMCEKSFYPRNKLIIHLKSHKKNTPYKCPECLKKFVFAENLRRHALTHKGVKPFICEICEKGNSIHDK